MVSSALPCLASRSPAGVLLVWDHDPPTDAGDEALVWLVAPEQIVEAIRDAFHFASPRSPQGKRPDGLGDSLAVWCRTVSPTVLDARMSMPSMVVTWFAEGRRPDVLMRVGGTVGCRWRG